jgi:hypothetical protein
MTVHGLSDHGGDESGKRSENIGGRTNRMRLGWTVDFMSAMHRIRAGGSGRIAYQRDMIARFDIDAVRALIRDSLSTTLDRRRWRDGTGPMQSIAGRKGHQAE